MIEELRFKFGGLVGSEVLSYRPSALTVFVGIGCIMAGVPLDIVRLSYGSAGATARLLPSADLVPLIAVF